MDVVVELIPDPENVSREIFRPQLTNAEAVVVYDMLFEFPNGLPESVIWRRHCETEGEVHDMGIAHESAKKARRPDVEYLGFGTASAGRIRSIAEQIRDGHGFEVKHEPSEGNQHAEVAFQLINGVSYGELKRNQKQELKFVLGNLFRPMNPR